jgi:hypothetical protein
MDLQIFKGKTGVSTLKEYTNEEALKLIYAIGWYNNFKLSSVYQLNRALNEYAETDSFEFYSHEVASNVNFKFLSSRSLHTKRIDVENTPTNIAKQILTLIYETAEILKKYASTDTVSFLISPQLAKDVVNNEALYNTLKVDEQKAAGASLIYLGTLADYPTYINLLDDTSRICAVNTKNLNNRLSYLTTYIKY